MTNQDFIRQKRLFYSYRMLSRFYLYLPILVIFLYKQGLSYLFIGIVLASYGIAVMALNPFVRNLVKLFSVKKVLFIGEWLKCIGIAGIAISQNNIYLLIISQVFVGFGFSLTAGTDSSLLYRWTELTGKTDEYREIEGKSQSYIFMVVLVSGIIGAILAGINLNLPFYMTIPFNFCASFIILFMFEDKSANGRKSGEGTGVPLGRRQKERFYAKNYLHVILYYAINRAMIMTFFVLVLPLLLFIKGNINITLFGFILGLFSLTAFFVGRYIKPITGKMKDGILWAGIPLMLMIDGFLLTLSWEGVYFIIPILLGLSAGLVRPLSYDYINQNAGEDRAKAIHLAEFLFALLNSLFLIIIASLFVWNINFGLYIVTSILLFVSIYQWFYHRMIKGYRQKDIYNITT